MKKPRFPRLLKLLAGALCGLASSSVLTAQTTMVFNDADADQNYNNANNWFDNVALGAAGRTPITGDTVIINNDKIANLSDDVSANVPVILRVGNAVAAGATGTLNINAGGSLAATTVQVSFNGADDRLTVDGGALSSPNAVNLAGAGGIMELKNSGTFTNTTASGTRTIFQGAGELKVTSGGSVTANSTTATEVMDFKPAVVTVEGGSISTNARIRFGFGNATELNITGPASTISAVALMPVTAGLGTAFNYTFDATGVGKIVLSGFGNATGVIINVDGSAYAGGPAVFDLIDAPNISGLPLSVNVTGLGVENVDYRVNQSTTTNVLQVEILGESPPSTLVFNDAAADQDYTNAGNWYDQIALAPAGRTPITGDTIIFNNNKTANLAADVSAEVPTLVRVGNSASATGTLNINSGGVLAATEVQVSSAGAADLLSVNAGGTLETTSAVNLTNAAGTLQVTGAGAVFRNTTDAATNPQIVFQGAGTLSVAAGGTVEVNNPSDSLVTHDFKNATITVDGGTITSDARIRFGFGSATTLNINGSTSLVSCGDLMPTQAGAGTTFNYTFDATGVGSIQTAGFAHLRDTAINVDVTALGGNGGLGLNAVFDLVDTANLASLPLLVNVTGIAGVEGVDWHIRQDMFLNVFQLVIGDPPLEPIFLDIQESGSDLVITVDADNSKTGFDYTLDASTDLDNWLPLDTKPGTGSDITFTVPKPASGVKNFYRVTTAPQ